MATRARWWTARVPWQVAMACPVAAHTARSQERTFEGVAREVLPWRQPVASVMGLLEEREAAARVRVEELQAEVEAESDRILAELGAAEAVRMA